MGGWGEYFKDIFQCSDKNKTDNSQRSKLYEDEKELVNEKVEAQKDKTGGSDWSSNKAWIYGRGETRRKLKELLER